MTEPAKTLKSLDQAVRDNITREMHQRHFAREAYRVYLVASGVNSLAFERLPEYAVNGWKAVAEFFRPSAEVVEAPEESR